VFGEGIKILNIGSYVPGNRKTEAKTMTWMGFAAITEERNPFCVI
jgi:hypothetical protein